MTEHISRPPLTGLIAGALVVLGVLLWMFVSKTLLFVAGFGAFGPGLLRELGWLKDHDEFQRQAAHRAGYHAYLAGGFAALLVISKLGGSSTNPDASAEWIMFILVVLWLSWMFSSVLSYWGARKTAFVVLVTFGSFWAVFAIASLIGEFDPNNSFWVSAQGLLAGAGMIAAFFVPAWAARRWPRLTGVLLLALAAGSLLLFGGKNALPLPTVVFTNTLFAGPLIVTGFALLREGGKVNEGVE